MFDWKHSALVVVVLLWAGILFGVSFLATPAKFGAPNLTLSVAVEVGRSTFSALNRVELGGAVLVIGLLLAGASRQAGVWFASGLALLGLLLQTLWLLPVLDERAQVVINGGTPPASVLHEVYITVDAARFLALVAVAFFLLSEQDVDAAED